MLEHSNINSQVFTPFWICVYNCNHFVSNQSPKMLNLEMTLHTCCPPNSRLLPTSQIPNCVYKFHLPAESHSDFHRHNPHNLFCTNLTPILLLRSIHPYSAFHQNTDNGCGKMCGEIDSEIFLGAQSGKPCEANPENNLSLQNFDAVFLAPKTAWVWHMRRWWPQ